MTQNEKGRRNQNRIKQSRERLNLTQSELANLLGISAQTLSNWETGRTELRLSIPEMVKMARTLRLSIYEFVCLFDIEQI